MHSLANGLLSAGVSLLSSVWKMCQIQGFPCFSEYDHFDESLPKVSFSLSYSSKIFHSWV